MAGNVTGLGCCCPCTTEHAHALKNMHLSKFQLYRITKIHENIHTDCNMQESLLLFLFIISKLNSIHCVPNKNGISLKFQEP